MEVVNQEATKQMEATDVKAGNQIMEKPSMAMAMPEDIDGDWGTEGVSSDDFVIPKILLMHGQSSLVLQGENKQGDLVMSTTKETLCPKGSAIEVIPFFMYKTWRISEMVDGRAEWRKEEAYNVLNADAPWEYVEDGKRMRRDKALNFYVLLATEAKAGDAIPLKLQFLRTSMKAGKTIAGHFAKSKAGKKTPAMKSFYIGSEFINGGKDKYFIFTTKEANYTTFEQIRVCKKWYNVISKANAPVRDHESNESQVIPSTEGESVDF